MILYKHSRCDLNQDFVPCHTLPHSTTETKQILIFAVHIGGHLTIICMHFFVYLIHWIFRVVQIDCSSGGVVNVWYAVTIIVHDVHLNCTCLLIFGIQSCRAVCLLNLCCRLYDILRPFLFAFLVDWFWHLLFVCSQLHFLVACLAHDFNPPHRRHMEIFKGIRLRGNVPCSSPSTRSRRLHLPLWACPNAKVRLLSCPRNNRSCVRAHCHVLSIPQPGMGKELDAFQWRVVALLCIFITERRSWHDDKSFRNLIRKTTCSNGV